MKILAIASILPVPGVIEENNYVIDHVKNHQSKFPKDEFIIIRPSPKVPGIIVKAFGFGKKWMSRNIVAGIPFYLIEKYRITVLKYFSAGRSSLLHSFLSKSIILFNRKIIDSNNSQDVNLIHAHNLFPDGLLAYHLNKKFNIPYILTLQQEVRFLKNSLSRKSSFKILNSAKGVSTFSPIMHARLAEYGFRNASIIAPGIDKRFFTERDIRSPQPSVEKLRLVSVCNLVPVKNIEAVIIALSGINHKEFSYTIYGIGPLEKELKELTTTLGLDGTIEFKGRVKNEELPTILPEYDLFIQPSFKETFGLSYFEALACGLPVVLTENTGAWHFIKNFNVAFVVDPFDVNSIKDCLSKIINDRNLLVEKSKRCRESAGTASWDNCVDFFHNVYQKVNNGIAK